MMALTGCASSYRHPNYEFNSAEYQLNFDKDRQACALPSAREHCVERKEKTSMICERNTSGGHNCREITPRSCTFDTLEQCMYRKGWRKADVNGNYLE